MCLTKLWPSGPPETSTSHIVFYFAYPQLTLHLHLIFLISPTFCIIYFLVSCLHCSLLLCINFSSLLSLLFLSCTTSILDFSSYYFPSGLVSSRLGASLTSSRLFFCLCLLSPALPLLVLSHLISPFFFTCLFSPVLSSKSCCDRLFCWTGGFAMCL